MARFRTTIRADLCSPKENTHETGYFTLAASIADLSRRPTRRTPTRTGAAGSWSVQPAEPPRHRERQRQGI
jgi:hypothetical protein